MAALVVAMKPPPAPLASRSPREVVAMALRTAMAEPARVFLPALVIFGLDAINSTFFTEVEIHIA